MNILNKLLIFFMTLAFEHLSSNVYLAPSPFFKPKVEISAIYITFQDKILLLHRQDHKSQGNKWGIPGGKIEKNETPLQAAVREVQEETGYDISGQKIESLGTVYIEYSPADHFTYHMFRTALEDEPGDVKIDFNEHKGFTWVTPSDALKMELLQDEAPCIRLVYFPTKTIQRCGAGN